MIGKVEIIDLSEIFELTKSCGKDLVAKCIFQWNELYPSLEVLKKDIDLGQIWKLTIQHKIVGIIVLTEIEDVEYKNVQWISKNSRNLYIHRLAVHPNFQQRGFAQQLMDFAEHFAVENGYKSVRLDTFSGNLRNRKFYENRNYQKLEAIYFPKQSELPFYCYELILGEK